MSNMDAMSIAQRIIVRYRQAQQERKCETLSSRETNRNDYKQHHGAGRRQTSSVTRYQSRRRREADRKLLVHLDTRAWVRAQQQLEENRALKDHFSVQPPDANILDTPLTMAAPPEITIQNLSGTYILNHTLSDSSQAVLKMQNINFLVRRAVQYSGVTVNLSQYTDSAGLQHLDQEQLSTGGIKNFEDRIMDWEWTDKHNWIWGKVHGKSRYTRLENVEDPDGYLREGWERACVEGEVVEGYVESVTDGWTARQVWGFAVVEGERRHVRRVLARKKGWKDQRIRLVYDWKGRE